MATFSTSLTYNMERLSPVMPSGTFTTILTVPTGNEMYFINQIDQGRVSNTFEVARQGKDSLSNTALETIKTNITNEDRADFLHGGFQPYLNNDATNLNWLDAYGWRILYPGDVIRMKNSGAQSHEAFIWITKITLGGTFTLS